MRPVPLTAQTIDIAWRNKHLRLSVAGETAVFRSLSAPRSGTLRFRVYGTAKASLARLPVPLTP